MTRSKCIRENDFHSLFMKISDLQTTDFVESFDCVIKLKKLCNKGDKVYIRWFAIILFVALLSSVKYFFDSSYYWKQNEACFVKVPEKMEYMFVKRFNCSFCNNMRRIEKVENISRQEFEEKFAYSGVPVVVTDAMVNWTTNVFNFNFFKNLYLNISASEDSEINCQFFPYKTNFTSLRQVWEMSEERAVLRDKSDPWYIGWSNCNPFTANILRKHYHKPYFLPENSESSRIDWMFMGSPGYGAHLHIDHVGNPSWQAQISGHKVWTIQAPPECYLQCQTIEVTVNPGEILVIDTDKWFHKTDIVGDQISITIGSEFD